jgi:DNA-binding NtrC family response regulator
MEQKNILIIEDERNLARTLAQALRVGLDRKFEIETCESGEEAFHKLHEKPYSLIISDLRLPGIDGLELINYIKRFFSDTHVILITGFGSEEVEAKANQITEGYLTKPFDILDLLRMVQKVIDPRQKKNGAFQKDDLTDDGPHRILIMEDDLGLRTIFGKVLRKSHYEVHEAPTVQTARDFLGKNEYKVFICDIHMGRERGTDLLSEFGDKLTEAGTQIVMCSAYGQYRSLTEEMGADFFLEKPISLGTFITLINRLMDYKPIPSQEPEESNVNDKTENTPPPENVVETRSPPQKTFYSKE